MSQNIKLVREYFKALSENDFATVDSLLHDDLIWHQPGKGVLSGTFKGKEAVFAHLGNFTKLSNGTFAIDRVGYMAENNNLVAAEIHFKASAGNESMKMKGIDLFRVEAGKIQEVWLFSEDIDAEDKFWTSLAKG